MNQEILKNNLIYDLNSGKFYWKQENYYNKIKAFTEAGTISSTGYRLITINCKIYYAHRLAWLYVYGYLPENNIDHINRNPDDNRIENLREVSRQCNLRNSKVSSANKTGVKGICYDPKNHKWKAQIRISYVTKN